MFTSLSIVEMMFYNFFTNFYHLITSHLVLHSFQAVLFKTVTNKLVLYYLFLICFTVFSSYSFCFAFMSFDDVIECPRIKNKSCTNKLTVDRVPFKLLWSSVLFFHDTLYILYSNCSLVEQV